MDRGQGIIEYPSQQLILHLILVLQDALVLEQPPPATTLRFEMRHMD